MSQDPEPAEGCGRVHACLICVMRDLEPLAKDRKNSEQQYRFRGIDDVYNALQPLLAMHGLYTVTRCELISCEQVTSKKGSSGYRVLLRVAYRLIAADGSWVETTAIGEAIDYGDKATPKAMAMAHKYALLQMFCIPTEGEGPTGTDTENASHDLQPAQATPAQLHKAKQALLAMVTQRRSAVKSTMSHADWIAAVTKAELGKDKIETLADLEQVKEAITENRYDSDKASQIPF